MKPENNPFAGVALSRLELDRIEKNGRRLYAKEHGAEQRIAAAVAKRNRKNAKRVEVMQRGGLT